jgi:membrane associated rhomboid family serine protease
MRKIHYNAPVTLTFALLAFGVLILGILTGDRTTQLLFSVHRGSPADPLFYVRLFGHVLGHAGWNHYFGNFLLILLLGPLLEDRYGSKTLLLMMAGTALLTGLLHVALFNTTVMGASGIVFMMIMLSAFVNIRAGSIPLTVILVAAIYIGREVYDGILAVDNVSQFSHIAGGVLGCVFGFAAKTRGGRK